MDRKLRKRIYRCRTCHFYNKDNSVCSLKKPDDDHSEYRFPDDYCEFWTLPYWVMLAGEGFGALKYEGDIDDLNNLEPYSDGSIVTYNGKPYLVKETRYRGHKQKTAIEV